MNVNKSKTTYGVYNLIEWHALLHLGKGRVKVTFTGGSITTQGVTPATFTTEDPVVQFAIERSPEFKSGKIKVVRRVKLEGLIPIERNGLGPRSEALAQNHSGAEAGTSGLGPRSEALAQNHSGGMGQDGGGGFGAEDGAGSSEEGGETAAAGIGMTQVEFASNDEAKDYLEQNFGLVRSKLRNKEDIYKAGKANGVEIFFV